MISAASVVGRSFGLRLLQEVLPDAPLHSALSDLQRLDLVVEERRRPAPEYRFRHGLVQEVAYGRMVEARRRELHLAVGEALERLSAGGGDENVGLLAHHFAEAEDMVRAVTYQLRAGDAARSLYADREALEHYGHALAFMDRSGDDTRARETLLKMALTHHLAFDFESAGRALEDAFSRAAPEPTQMEPAEDVETAHLAPPRFGFVPGVSNDTVSHQLVLHLYRGLVRIGRDMEVVPDIAQTFTVSADGLTYRFRLRPDARWSDGAPVTAADFARSWLQRRGEAASGAALLADVVTAEAVDTRTLEVRIREPRNYFLHLLAHPITFPAPQHLVEALGDRWYETEPLVSNGPFALAEATDTHATFAASESWTGQRGNVRTVRVTYARGQDRRVSDWLDGRYDVLFAESRRVDDSAPNTILDAAPALGTTYLGFVVQRPPLDDSVARRAIAHAIDRESVAANAGYAMQPSGHGGFLPPAMPGHSHRVAPAFDPSLARRLLDDAGYGTSREPLHLTIAVPESMGPEIGRELVRQLATVGIDAVSPLVPFSSLMQSIAETADAWVWGYVADYPDPDGLLRTFLSEDFGHASDEVRGLVERARSARDRDERLRMYRQAEHAWLADDVTLVPLAYHRNFTLRRPWVHGIWTNAIANSTLSDAIVCRNAAG